MHIVRCFKGFVIVLILVVFPDFAFSQTNLKADLNFRLDDSLFVDQSFKLGLTQHPNKDQLVEGLLIRDYILGYEVGNQWRDFHFEEENPDIDVVVTAPATYPRAVVNIGFWGIVPNGTSKSYSFAPYLVKKNQSIIAFFSDLMNSGFEGITKVAVNDIKLVVVRFKAKNNETDDALLYSAMQERIKIQSRYLFVLWDSHSQPDLPNILQKAEMKIYPLKRDNLLEYLYKTPLIFSSDIFQSEKEEGAFAHVNFGGKYPDSIKLEYEIKGVSGNLAPNLVSLAKQGIDIFEKLPPFALMPDESIKVRINKPPGYNIAKIDESPDQDWETRLYELNVRRAGEFDLTLNKIPDFEFYYLDVGSLENRKQVISEVYEKINALASEGDRFLLFISYGNKPIVTSDPNDLYSVLSKAGNIMPDPPDQNFEVKYLVEEVKWTEILKANNQIKVNYYLPERTYALNQETLIQTLLLTIDHSRSWQVYLNVYGKYKEMKGESRNVYYYPIPSK